MGKNHGWKKDHSPNLRDESSKAPNGGRHSLNLAFVSLLQRTAEQPFFFLGGLAQLLNFFSDFSLEILEAPPLHGDDKEEIAEIEVHGVTYGCFQK